MGGLGAAHWPGTDRAGVWLAPGGHFLRAGLTPRQACAQSPCHPAEVVWGLAQLNEHSTARSRRAASPVEESPGEKGVLAQLLPASGRTSRVGWK